MSDAPSFPVDELRRQFPAIERGGQFVFFDNAAGAQIPDRVLAAVTDHLLARNVQRGGPYRHSREVDAMIARARESVAAFVNARGADEIAFGLNATSFIRAISLAVGQTLDRRPEIVVSDLDHEANVATWLALQRAGARIVWWQARAGADGARLHAQDLDPLLNERTRIVACTLASNAIGSVVDIAEVSRRAHAAGAEVFVDAVQFAPHRSIDVQALGCDYLVCSGYKVFAPHMGFAWCRREAINRLPTFREDFIPDVTPDKLEAGTYVYENVAGMEAAILYLEQLGVRLGAAAGASRREVIRTAMEAIAGYERTLSADLLEAVLAVNGAVVHGVVDRSALAERVPTVSFTIDGAPSSTIAAQLAVHGIGARSGHMYAPRLMQRLNVMPEGTVRVSLVHYNTAAEIARFGEVLGRIVAQIRPSPLPSVAGRSAARL